MKIEQITIRPDASKLLIRYRNNLNIAGANTIAFTELSDADNAAVSTILTLAQSKVPADPPASVKQEIQQLETRLAELRKSIGLSVDTRGG